MPTPQNRPHILERVVKEGIRCPNCNCGYCPVEKQEIREINFQSKKHVIVRRRRICQHCKLPFATVETPESEDILGLPDLIAQVPTFQEQLELLKETSDRSGILLPKSPNRGQSSIPPKENSGPARKPPKNPYLED